MISAFLQLRPHIYLPGVMYIGKHRYSNKLRQFYLGIARFDQGYGIETIYQLIGIGFSAQRRNGYSKAYDVGFLLVIFAFEVSLKLTLLRRSI